MEEYTISLRLNSRTIGRISAQLDTHASLSDAKDRLTKLAQQCLGYSVVIKRFMVTSCGRTGYLQSHQEQVPITECCPVITLTNAVLDLGVLTASQVDHSHFKNATSPLKRSCSSNSMLSAGDHFELYYERFCQ